MSGKPTSGRRRIHMLHAFAMDYAYIALQRELQRMEKTGDTVEGEENCSVLECYQWQGAIITLIIWFTWPWHWACIFLDEILCGTAIATRYSWLAAVYILDLSSSILCVGLTVRFSKVFALPSALLVGLYTQNFMHISFLALPLHNYAYPLTQRYIYWRFFHCQWNSRLLIC